MSEEDKHKLTNTLKCPNCGCEDTWRDVFQDEDGGINENCADCSYLITGWCSVQISYNLKAEVEK